MMLIDKDFILKPLEVKVATGYEVPTLFGNKPIFKTEVQYVPDYEQTNIVFANKIYTIIKEHAKDLGEITKIELVPSCKQRYELLIHSITCDYKEKIEVPEHYGDKVEE